jgi:ATP-dependent helicase/nuclease subunit B
MYNSLFSHPNNNTLILTANERLSHFLRDTTLSREETNGHLYQRSHGNTISSLSLWITNLWEEFNKYSENPLRLLTEFQEQSLWEEVIKQTTSESELLQVSSMAQLARQAWQLIHQYNVPLTEFENEVLSDDTQTFYEWFQAYRSLCNTNRWITNDRLPFYLSKRVTQYRDRLASSNPGLLPQHIILVGFLDIPPHYQYFFNHLSSLGIVCQHYQLPNLNSTASQRVVLPDTDAEIEAMARFAKQQLINKQQHNGRQGFIGCIVPQLSKLRSKVLSTFIEVCAPQAIMPDQIEPSLPFNMSLGQSLTEFPLIQSAFQCLSLNKSELSFETISTVLMSPFIGHAETEWALRIQLDIGLRQHAECKMTLDEWIRQANYYHCMLLSTQLQEYRSLCGRIPKQQELVQWASVFKQLLFSLGWPGERSLTPLEQQLTDRWDELITELGESSLLSKRLSYFEALQRLQRLAATVIFQEKTETKPIQIMGILEAVGLEFDSIWVMGLQHDQWPSPPSRNPLLPYSLQQRFKMPHASAEQEYRFCKKMTQWFFSNTSQSIFSSPEWDKDRPLRVSGLIHSIPLIHKDQLALAPYEPLEIQIYNTLRYQASRDEYGPRITGSEECRGGSSLFKYQAACPFKAFAEIRLGAQALPTPQLALLASERGAIIHKVLEMLWGELKSKDKLMQYSHQDLERLLESIIDTVLNQFKKKKPRTFHPRFIAIEKKRLVSLIIHWLEHEKNRPPFEVFATELSFNAEIRNLTVQMRIDRVDKLTDNRFALIDYKTGNVSINGWFGERTDEPQLPLYCVTSTNPIGALLLGKIHYSSKGYIGISENPIGISGVFTCEDAKQEEAAGSWLEQIQQWNKNIQTLADEFYSGYAKVDPKYGFETCQTCQLQGLCRYNGNVITDTTDRLDKGNTA